MTMETPARSHTLSSISDIANRELPDLPPEAYGSKISRIWSTVKKKLTLQRSSNVPGEMRRSHSVHGDRKKTGKYQNSLPYSIYYHLIDNNESMVLPGLRAHPPPIEDDENTIPDRRLSLPPPPANRNPDYADIDVIAQVHPDAQPPSPDNPPTAPPPAAAAVFCAAPVDNPPPINEYHNIDELSTNADSEQVALRPNPAARVNPGRRTATLSSSINTLHHQGWYWGPLSREETEAKLRDQPAGSFLVRDSNDEHHLYTLSFKQRNLMLHTRIEFVNGLFTFFLSEAKARATGKPSVEELINSAIADGVKGEFGEFRRPRGRQSVPIKIILTTPVSRLNEVRSLQFLCRFVLRANMNRDNVADLPLPEHIKPWVHERKYF